MPKESHNTDFSRIKPWYLDGQYVYHHIFAGFHSSPFFSALHTYASRYFYPLSRHLKPGHCTTVAYKTLPGKPGRRKDGLQSRCPKESIRQVTSSLMLANTLTIPVTQNFVHFDCANPKDEAEKRFNYFTTQVISSCDASCHA